MLVAEDADGLEHERFMHQLLQIFLIGIPDDMSLRAYLRLHVKSAVLASRTSKAS